MTSGGRPVKHGTFDPKARAEEKRLSREKDDRDMAEGRATPDEVNRRNGFLSCLGDLGKARIAWRKWKPPEE